MSIREVGKLLGITNQAVNAAELRALAKIRMALRPARGEEVRDG